MLALSVVLTHSQAPGQAQKSAIIDMLQKQAADWNRGDMETFAAGYKKSPDILFMGDPIRRGYDQMLAGYRKSFPTRDAMGTLTFTGLEVQPLDNQFATVTGRFHLQRSAAGGGDAGGYFLLVVEKTSSGWKIIRDDTTGDARKH
ncbi:MAG TPA: nuclear transport factor 2 family protein [Acidobacteriaceae bacterium]|jgi:ketosteroid isomerase-like protein|nr:nuclear transport factor 2 family protein [Acidobacteriaceae bacterium]